MRPFIIGGRDAVTIKKYNGGAKNFDIVFYKRQNGKYVMHRVIKREGETIFVCGDNQYYLEKITEDMIFASVVKTRRRMDGAAYFIYCRTLWLRRFYCHVRQWTYNHVFKGGKKK